MTDLYWASASESLCHEADRISAPELVGGEEVLFKVHIDFEWQDTFPQKTI